VKPSRFPRMYLMHRTIFAVSLTISATFASAASLSAGDVTTGDGGAGTLKSGVTKSGYGLTVSLPVTATYVSGTTVTASYNFTSAKSVSLESVGSIWQFPVSGSSVTGARKIYIPVETKDGTYTIIFTVKALDPQATALTGSNVYLTSTKSANVTVKGDMYSDDFTGNS
jgi:outer membrane protein assembly factor BamB